MSIFYYQKLSVFSSDSSELPGIIAGIDEIAILVEQNLSSFPLPSGKNDGTIYPPRLTLSQLNRATRDYPFQLPLEVQILYQRGNGCIPIGVGNNKNWDSFDNYCNFKFPHTLGDGFMRQSINPSCSLNWHYLELYEEADPRWFPISSVESGEYVVIGSRIQQATSPVLFIGDDLQGYVAWESLTSMVFEEAKHMKENIMKSKLV